MHALARRPMLAEHSRTPERHMAALVGLVLALAVAAYAGAPLWWPEFCATYDIVAAGVMSWLLRRDARLRARLAPSPSTVALS
jgi:hypothetical protein